MSTAIGQGSAASRATSRSRSSSGASSVIPRRTFSRGGAGGPALSDAGAGASASSRAQNARSASNCSDARYAVSASTSSASGGNGVPAATPSVPAALYSSVTRRATAATVNPSPTRWW
ncbi:hypothetical protein GCM10022420_064220 [Streptomyces iranensis]